MVPAWCLLWGGWKCRQAPPFCCVVLPEPEPQSQPPEPSSVHAATVQLTPEVPARACRLQRAVRLRQSAVGRQRKPLRQRTTALLAPWLLPGKRLRGRCRRLRIRPSGLTSTPRARPRCCCTAACIALCCTACTAAADLLQLLLGWRPGFIFALLLAEKLRMCLRVH